MQEKIEYINHEYDTFLTDRLLFVLKKVIPNPEKRHDYLASFARWARWIPGPRLKTERSLEQIIRFKDKSNPLYMNSPIILAAGGNKDGVSIASFANLGFGGVSVGTATRRPRTGNPYRPRIRMIEEDFAIQNSMGLNNVGIDEIAHRVDSQLGQTKKRRMSIGISVAETPGIEDEEMRQEDIIYTFRKAYNAADYVEINLSCPNTGHQRIDAQLRYLDRILSNIMKIRKSLPVRKAVYAKLSPDMGEEQLLALLSLVESHGINGLVLFNTFPGTRGKYLGMKTPIEALQPVREDGDLGGLSGRPLYINTFRAVEYIKNAHPDLSIIACGGVDHGAKVFDLLRLGADAVQIYSALSYRWFAPVRMLSELHRSLLSTKATSLDDLLHGGVQF